MDFDKLFKIINEINSKGDFSTVRSTNSSNELLETLKIVENCTCNLYGFHGSINEIENYLTKLEEEGQERRFRINELNRKLNEIDVELNKKILCESCKGKKIERLTDKCENEEMARIIYESKLNAE